MSGAPLPHAEVVGVGLVTPVGMSAAAVASAVRAGRSRARFQPVVTGDLESLGMHLVDDEYLEELAPGLEGRPRTQVADRMLRLGGPALAEAAEGCPVKPPLLLVLPEVRPGATDPLADDFLADLAIQAAIAIDEESSTTYRRGGAGALLAIRDAHALLSEKRASHVLVGAVDSLLDFRRLEALGREGRLYGPNSRLGFMPGEGAAFLLLRAPAPPDRAPAPQTPPPLARLIAVGTGEEKGHRYGTEPYRGDGLAEAFEAVFRTLPASQPQVRCVYAGLNGEDMPAKEWGVASLRNSEHLAEELRVEHPADCVGDSGAALGAIMLGLGVMAISRGHQAGPHPCWTMEDPGPVLVWSTSDTEARAAALLQW